MPALLPFLFLSTASAFLLWAGGRLGWGGRIPIHELAEPGTAYMVREQPEVVWLEATLCQMPLRKWIKIN